MALVFTGKNLKLYNNETDGQLQIRYWDNDGKRKRNRVPKDADPIAFAKKMDDILGQTKTLTVAERAMDEMMERYKDLMRSHVENYRNNSKHGKQLAESTFDKNRSYIDQHIIPYFGSDNIAHITPKNILRWQDWMQDRVKSGTANSVLGVLNRAMGWFVLEEYIPVNPCAEIENLPTHTVYQGYTPTSAEVAQLLDEAHHRNFSDDPVTQATFGDERDLKTWMWHHLLLRLCAETGCRISEALALEWSKVRGDTIIISQSAVNARVGKTKTDYSNRIVPIGATLSALFKEYRFIVGTHRKFVFLNSKGNHFRGTCVDRQVLQPAIKRAGLKSFGWNGLRRAYITHLLDNNMSERHVQKLCGHAPGSKMTRAVYDKVKSKDVLTAAHIVQFG